MEWRGGVEWRDGVGGMVAKFTRHSPSSHRPPRPPHWRGNTRRWPPATAPSDAGSRPTRWHTAPLGRNTRRTRPGGSVGAPWPRMTPTPTPASLSPRTVSWRRPARPPASPHRRSWKMCWRTRRRGSTGWWSGVSGGRRRCRRWRTGRSWWARSGGSAWRGAVDRPVSGAAVADGVGVAAAAAVGNGCGDCGGCCGCCGCGIVGVVVGIAAAEIGAWVGRWSQPFWSWSLPWRSRDDHWKKKRRTFIRRVKLRNQRILDSKHNFKKKSAKFQKNQKIKIPIQKLSVNYHQFQMIHFKILIMEFSIFNHRRFCNPMGLNLFCCIFIPKKKDFFQLKYWSLNSVGECLSTCICSCVYFSVLNFLLM